MDFTKYSKTFLMGYRDVNRIKLSSQLFNIHTKSTKLNEKKIEIVNLQKAYDDMIDDPKKRSSAK